MNNRITLGSLFDGSGGFPLGGLICGVEPLWASEIEPFPVRVTTKRIPEMKHFGDVSKLIPTVVFIRLKLHGRLTQAINHRVKIKAVLLLYLFKVQWLDEKTRTVHRVTA